MSKTLQQKGLLTAGAFDSIIHTCSNIVGVDGKAGRVNKDQTSKRVVDILAKLLYNTFLTAQGAKLMHNVNLVSNGTVTVLAKKLPFKNNFVQRNFVRMERTRNGRDAIVANVVCTEDSGEAGRVYTVCYTLNGTMMWCVC